MLHRTLSALRVLYSPHRLPVVGFCHLRRERSEHCGPKAQGYFSQDGETRPQSVIYAISARGWGIHVFQRPGLNDKSCRGFKRRLAPSCTPGACWHAFKCSTAHFTSITGSELDIIMAGSFIGNPCTIRLQCTGPLNAIQWASPRLACCAPCIHDGTSIVGHTIISHKAGHPHMLLLTVSGCSDHCQVAQFPADCKLVFMLQYSG